MRRLLIPNGHHDYGIGARCYTYLVTSRFFVKQMSPEKKHYVKLYKQKR